MVVPDTEGQRADFAAGPEYGMNTLDSIRAAFNSPTVGLPGEAKIALLGYSGGAIASEWAAELAPTYAPERERAHDRRGDRRRARPPAHNLHYIEGTYFWAGVLPMALIGIARAFEVDFTPYLSADGLKLYHGMQATSIANVLGQLRYWRLNWADLVKPAYPTPESLPLFVTLANKLIMGTGGTPTIPLFIGQGANGDLEWTPGNKPGIGAGDGVMIAGDVRTLARTYCENGTLFTTSSTTAEPHHCPFGSRRSLVAGSASLETPPQNCSSIPPGNSAGPDSASVAR